MTEDDKRIERRERVLPRKRCLRRPHAGVSSCRLGPQDLTVKHGGE